MQKWNNSVFHAALKEAGKSENGQPAATIVSVSAPISSPHQIRDIISKAESEIARITDQIAARKLQDEKAVASRIETESLQTLSATKAQAEKNFSDACKSGPVMYGPYSVPLSRTAEFGGDVTLEKIAQDVVNVARSRADKQDVEIINPEISVVKMPGGREHYRWQFGARPAARSAKAPEKPASTADAKGSN